MDAIADAPWSWFACAFAAFLFAAWWHRRAPATATLAAAAGTLVLALAPLLLAALRDTPRKQVARALEALRAALERRDAEGTLFAVSARFQAGALDRKGLDAIVRREFVNYTPDFVGVAPRETVVEGDLATVRLDASTGGDYRSGGLGQIKVPLFRLRFELAFRKEGDAWKLAGAKRFDWQGEPPQEIPLDAKR